jgi:hypothetical protein
VCACVRAQHCLSLAAARVQLDQHRQWVRDSSASQVLPRSRATLTASLAQVQLESANHELFLHLHAAREHVALLEDLRRAPVQSVPSVAKRVLETGVAFTPLTPAEEQALSHSLRHLRGQARPARQPVAPAPPRGLSCTAGP